ncbi:hypothetical protein AB7Z32_19980 [Bradyrhizobium sp. 482_C4_N1_1]|uniref:hypothetical protein n=1 Tax=unclassified Bradyrhizobium TaxID=2631580 RepID=UPI0033936879
MSTNKQREPVPGSASDIKRSRDFWLYGAENPKSIKAERNLSQLAEWDDRLTPAARKVLDFLIDWEHDGRGDALASREHITAHLNARAPDGCKISVRTVRDGIDCLLASGWAVRTLKGTGQKNASRYVVPPYILENAAHGKLPNVANRALHDAGLATTSTGRDVTPCTGRYTTPGNVTTGRDVTPQDTHTRDAPTDASTCSDIDIPQASPAAGGGELAGGFDLLAAAYAKPGDNLVEARRQYDAIAPDEAEQARMVRAAESWRASAKGPRMGLARWLEQKRWLTTYEFTQDNRRANRFPSCVVTWIKPAAGGGARVKYRDTNGSLQTQQLDVDELEYFTDACSTDRPACSSASDDLHEFIGARFHVDEDGCFCGYLGQEAA